MSDEPLQTFDSVWDAIEDTPAQAEIMRLRSSLMMALQEHITRERLSQTQAAKAFDVTQPRVSDLMRGKIDLFGLDSLVSMLAAAGMHVEVRVARRRTRSPGHEETGNGPACTRTSRRHRMPVMWARATAG
jgi:predicted XRE-type DNA-binding protein